MKDKWERATHFRRFHLLTMSFWLKSCTISLLLSHKPNSSVLMTKISKSLCRPIKCCYVVQSLNVYSMYWFHQITVQITNEKNEIQSLRYKRVQQFKRKGDCKKIIILMWKRNTMENNTLELITIPNKIFSKRRYREYF